MKWKNLERSCCPQCNKSLLTAWVASLGKFVCACGFQITEKRYKEITASRTSQMIEKDADRLLMKNGYE